MSAGAAAGASGTHHGQTVYFSSPRGCCVRVVVALHYSGGGTRVFWETPAALMLLTDGPVWSHNTQPAGGDHTHHHHHHQLHVGRRPRIICTRVRGPGPAELGDHTEDQLHLGTRSSCTWERGAAAFGKEGQDQLHLRTQSRTTCALDECKDQLYLKAMLRISCSLDTRLKASCNGWTHKG